MLVASPAFTPSAVRSVAISQVAGVGTRTSAATIAPLRWPAKSPSEVLDYTLDTDDWLADGSDELVGAEAILQPSGLTAGLATDTALLWITIVAGRPVVMLTGGNPGQTYNAAITIFTRVGRRARFAVSILVTDDDVASPPRSGALLTRTPQALGDPAGSALIADCGTALLVLSATVLLVSLLCDDGTTLAWSDSSALLICLPIENLSSAPPNALALSATTTLLVDAGTPLLFA